MQDDGGNVHQNGLAQGDFAGIARLLPEVYRAAAGRWMQQPQAQLQAQPQTQSQAQPQPVVNSAQQNMQTPNAQLNDLGVQPSQGLTAQNPQQPQVQAIPSAEDLTDIRQKLAALDTMMQSNPAYVETRRRGDWQTAAREAEKSTSRHTRILRRRQETSRELPARLLRPFIPLTPCILSTSRKASAHEETSGAVFSRRCA